MRLFDIARIATLVSCVTVLSACPKKETDAAPEPAATPIAPAAQAPNSDKAGVEPAAPSAAPAKKKADDDKGGW